MTITINGSGTITGISAGGLPDATIVQADLATGVAGTGPSFSAWASGATSLSANTLTKLLFATEEFDTNSNYDIATSKFTPTVAGYYQVNASWQAGTVASDLRIHLYKNGTMYKNMNTSANVSMNWTCGSALVYLNGSTDYIEIYGLSVLANTTNATQVSTYFQASLVRAA